VRELNGDAIRGRRSLGRGWSPATVSRILKNEKYVGRWTWNRTETRRDPMTGRKRRFVKAESEWHRVENEELRIVPEDVWDRVARRWQEVERTWPIRKSDRVQRGSQRSYVEANPAHLLSGMLRCASCGRAMGQVSGKGSGYYGCLTATKNACDNKLLVPRRLAERRLLSTIQERLSDAQAIRYVLDRVKIEVMHLHAHLPEQIKLKRAALATGERRIANFIDFIGGGKGTRALGEALEQAEHAAQALRDELWALEATADTIFEPPPVEWIAHRLSELQGLLERQTARSALLLRRILGPVRLMPVRPEVGRPYYQAETALQALELLEPPEAGSNWSRQWRRGESNPGRRGSEVIHGPRKRALISFDYPDSALAVPPFGHWVPRTSTLYCQQWLLRVPLKGGCQPRSGRWPHGIAASPNTRDLVTSATGETGRYTTEIPRNRA
jgi:hypothetical protein